MPQDSLALIIKRDGKEIVPKGDTKILAGDYLVLSVPVYNSEVNGDLEEITLDKNHGWCGKKISELNLPQNTLIAMITRNGKAVIPRGNKKKKKRDLVVLYSQDNMIKTT